MNNMPYLLLIIAFICIAALILTFRKLFKFPQVDVNELTTGDLVSFKVSKNGYSHGRIVSLYRNEGVAFIQEVFGSKRLLPVKFDDIKYKL